MNKIKFIHLLIPHVLWLFLVVFVLQGCSGAVDSVARESAAKESNQELETLNEAFKQIKDESSAQQALDIFESYANSRVSGGISLSGSNTAKHDLFSLTPAIAKKLAQKEWEFREKPMSYAQKINAKIRLNDSSDEILDVSELCDQKEASLQDGMSAQDLATIINDIADASTASLRLKSSDSTIVTALDIAHIQEKTKDLLPDLNPVNNARISPMEALVIGYALSTNDDGNAQNTELISYANQDQINAFVEKISE